MKLTRPALGRLLFVVLISLLVTLSACNTETPEPTATAVVAAETTDTPAAEVPTDEPTAEPTAEPEQTATAEPEPTATEEAEPTEQPAVQTADNFAEAPCEFNEPSGHDVTCGWLTVPEDRTDPANENMIQLHVAIFASDSDTPAPDPIVYLEGGPGGDALEAIPFTFSEFFAPYLANHDFIMFDQRGTGFSQPSLACPEYADLVFDSLGRGLSLEEEIQQITDTLLTCRDRLLAEGVNLAAYNSAASAADLNDLRIALGYDEWNILGISYGTRLAQTVMRDYPEGVRSIILDSSYPLEVNLLTDAPDNVNRAFDVFFAGCAADPVCNETYPDLETVFFDTVAQLNEEPLTFTVANLLEGGTHETIFFGDDLLGVLFQSLYATQIIPELPKLIYDVKQGDTTTLSPLMSSFLANVNFISIGMQYSVQCNEDYSFTNTEEVSAAAAEHPELSGLFDYSLGVTTLSICDEWGAGKADTIENEPVSSSIPTLVLAGEYDPITPPAWGQVVSTYLDNVYYYEFPGIGHGVSISGACPVTVVEAFLADPTSEPDTSCLAELGGPDFTVARGEAEAISLVPFTNEIFGLEGVVPEGWEEAGPGTFIRGDSALDQTVIIQQAIPGSDPSQFLELLAGQLGWEETPESTGTYDAENQSWTLYETEVQGLSANIALTEIEGTAVLIMLISAPDEREFLVSQVFTPALDALTIQE